MSNGAHPSDYAARELWTAIPCDSLECRRVIPTSESPTIRPEPSARAIQAAALVKCWLRLPSHSLHPVKDNRAVVIHARGSSLQRSRQNCSEPCCLMPADIPGCGFVVITTRRLCTINT